MPHDQTSRSPRRLLAVFVAAVAGSVASAGTVAAHEGSAHAGLPHWILLGTVVAGVAVSAGTIAVARARFDPAPGWVVSGVLAGIVVAMIGAVGLVEIQIEPTGTTSTAHDVYPLLTGVAGGGIATASLLLGRFRWPDRPRYAALGLALGGWVLYPVLFAGPAYHHPLGYLIVASVPVLVAFVLLRDVRPAMSRLATDRLARRVAAVVAVLFAVFFQFSAGLLSVTPDGVSHRTDGFVTVASFANPLVVWPAVEFYVPAIPLGGAVSVGTALVVGTLAGLIGINAGLLVTIWRENVALSSSNGAVGAVATIGATTCTCCGPAVYAIASAGLGVTASPLYWAFIDPLSPLGAIFLATAIVLLTGSAVRFTERLATAGICELPDR